ncbi:MAG TPA: dihydropteroate synthase, partial [Clostridia bacterium]|nr:dihydropteroate synthase [Clostridia bacterium]
SIDTMKPEVARQALGAGASIVNDVAALRNDPEMWQLVRETGAGYVCMHMRGDPRTMQDEPVYQDVVREVDDFFAERLRQLEDSGVQAEQIILDPGIGFGKNLEHNLQLIAASGHFARRGRPVLLGVSRKSFMNRLLGSGGEALLPASLACACFAVEAGIQLVRVHDVAETVKAVRMTEGIVARRMK